MNEVHKTLRIKIVIFLKALKGDKPAIVYPQLPESTDKTPKPSFDWYWL